MNLLGKIFFGAILVIVLLAIWLFGSPPAISMFWERADVTVMRHDTREVYDGWGNVVRTDPIVEIDNGRVIRTPIRLLVKNAVDGRDAVVDAWPVGATVSARLAPGGNVAYPATWRPFLLIPAIAFTIVAAFIGFLFFRPFFERRWRSQGGDAVRSNAGYSFRPIAFGFGVAFTAVPLILLYAMWTFGDPPPHSITWPRHDMRVVDSRVRPHQVGNGNIAAYLDVEVEFPDAINNEKILLQGITYGWVPIPEARELREARYLPGETVRAMQSPDGTFYVVRWRFSDFLAFFIIPLALITVPIGLFAMRLALV